MPDQHPGSPSPVSGVAAQYGMFITNLRRRKTRVKEARDLETETLSDNARIVASTGFRRLQAKAQVFSLEENAAVRTRLTHTLEVAMYGRLIAKQAFALI